MLTSSGGFSMLTVADRGKGGKICQNLADVILIYERSLCNRQTLRARRGQFGYRTVQRSCVGTTA